MKTPILHLVFLLIFFFGPRVIAQNISSEDQRFLDSLYRELKNSKADSTKIQLRCLIGQQTWTFRTGYWDSLAKDAKIYNVPLIECTALNNLSYVYQIHNDTTNFINSISKSLKIAEKHGYNSMILTLLTNLSNHYILTTRLKKGLSLAFQALKLAEEMKDKSTITNINGLIGMAYYSAGDYPKTLDKRLENLKIYKELHDSVNISSTLIAIGDTYEKLNDKTNCAHYYFEGAKFYRVPMRPSFGHVVYNAVGAAYTINKQYDSAAVYYAKAYKISESIGNKKSIAGTLVLIAENNYYLGKNTEAKKQSLKALDLCRELNFTTQIPAVSLTLEKIYLKEKNYKEALKSFELYVKISDSLRNDKNRKLASDKELDYEFEKKENENKLLSQQNQIQSLRINQNKNFILTLGAVLILVFIIGYLFLRQTKFKADQQSSQLEQKLLRSQMNPHFIFNSLQAIQNYILKHDEKEAVRYLSSFASVTRNVLENSRMDVIPLKKEISLLENYLQLQKLRFKNRFDYEIKVDEIIDTEHTSVPPMLAQPFIENAVEHGFHDIEGQGKITISYTVKNNELVMEIIDNGTGMKDGYSQNKQHQSLALEITKERVSLMNKKTKRKVVFLLAEAFPDQLERKGLKVSFTLPLTIAS